MRPGQSDKNAARRFACILAATWLCFNLNNQATAFSLGLKQKTKAPAQTPAKKINNAPAGVKPWSPENVDAESGAVMGNKAKEAKVSEERADPEKSDTDKGGPISADGADRPAQKDQKDQKEQKKSTTTSEPQAEAKPAAKPFKQEPDEISVDDDMPEDQTASDHERYPIPEPKTPLRPVLREVAIPEPKTPLRPVLREASVPEPKTPLRQAPSEVAPAEPKTALSPLKAPEVEAEKKESEAPPKPELPADPKIKLVAHTDLSGQFSYVVPNGWAVFAIPMQAHEVLSVRDKGPIEANVCFVHHDGKTDLGKLKENTLAESKGAFKKFVVMENKIETLPNGQSCGKIVTTEEIDEEPARQVQYILNPRKRYYLVVTMTVAKHVGNKYDRALLHIVNSLTSDKAH